MDTRKFFSLLNLPNSHSFICLKSNTKLVNKKSRDTLDETAASPAAHFRLNLTVCMLCYCMKSTTLIMDIPRIEMPATA